MLACSILSRIRYTDAVCSFSTLKFKFECSWETFEAQEPKGRRCMKKTAYEAPAMPKSNGATTTATTGFVFPGPKTGMRLPPICFDLHPDLIRSYHDYFGR